MISPLDSQSQLFLASMEGVQRQLAQAETQLTSGKKVSVPSDEPDVLSDLLRLRSALQRNTQIQSNLTVAQATATVSDDALSSSAKLLDQAQTIAAQGATATQDAAGRKTLASQIESLQDELVSFTQTQSGGLYVFSGDQDTQPAYQVNLANDNGVDRLITPSATRLVENPSGGSFVASMTAQDIFDHRNVDDSYAPDNAFAALNSLRVALDNNDVDGVNAAIDSLKLASDHLNQCQSFYGSVENRIQDGVDFTNKYQIQLQTEISQKEDADVTSAAIELSQGTVHLQAAFQMEGNLPRTTLFDFLTR